jgi:hypothetical protein
MIDGKLHKVEPIPEAVRTAADAALLQTIEQDKLNKSLDTAKAAASKSGASTEYRAPSAYKFLRPL